MTQSMAHLRAPSRCCHPSLARMPWVRIRQMDSSQHPPLWFQAF